MNCFRVESSFTLCGTTFWNDYTTRKLWLPICWSEECCLLCIDFLVYYPGRIVFTDCFGTKVVQLKAKSAPNIVFMSSEILRRNILPDRTAIREHEEHSYFNTN